MGEIGSGLITPLGGARVIQFPDSNGSSSFQIKDSDGFVIFEITSDGTVKTRRGIERI